MVRIDDIQLPSLPLDAPDFGDDPMPYFAEARARHAWLASSNLGPVLTEYRAMDEILRLDGNLKMPGENIVDMMGARGTGWGHFVEETMLARSGADHSRLRNSVRASFGPASVRRLQPIMRETVSALLDEWAPKRAFDFTEFAANFPVRVMFSLLGTSTEKLPEIISSLEIHGSSFNIEVEKMDISSRGPKTSSEADASNGTTHAPR